MNAFPYCPYYCEENAWHLCADARLGPGRREVVLVSNGARQVALWRQRAALGRDLPVLWDYHVIVVVVPPEGGARVFDLDTTLGLDVPVERYLDASFRAGAGPFAPRFRVVPAEEYRARLCTDRRHMRAADGTFREPPPPWPVIGDGHNLERFIDMRRSFVGEVLDLEGAWERWHPRSASSGH